MADRGGLSAEQAGRLLAQINSANRRGGVGGSGAAQSAGTAAKAAAAKTTGSTLGTKIAGGRCCSGYCGRRRGRSAAHHAEGQSAGVGRADRTGSEPETEPALTAEEKAVVQAITTATRII